jgi:hypothetical protein
MPLMQHIRLLTAFSAGCLFTLVVQGWSVRAQTDSKSQAAPSHQHRVEFSGRIVFTGMKKSDFVALFGQEDCSSSVPGLDCLRINGRQGD